MLLWVSPVTGKLLLMLQSLKRGVSVCPSDPKLHTCLVHFRLYGGFPVHGMSVDQCVLPWVIWVVSSAVPIIRGKGGIWK